MNLKNKTIIIIGLVVLIISITGIFFYQKSVANKNLEIKVETNGGVPFNWEYEIEDTSVVEFVKNKDVDGGPVNIIFTFKGLKEGKTTITLKYVDIVDKTVDSTKVYNVKVDNKNKITIY